MAVRRVGLRLALLLIGASVPSLALALATVEVTLTGAKAHEASIQLFDSNGAQVAPVGETRNRYSVRSGSYGVDVYADGQKIGSRRQINLADGNNQLRVDSVTGAVEVTPSIATGKPSLVAPVVPTSQVRASVGPAAVRVDRVNFFANPVNDQALISTPKTINMVAGEFGWGMPNGIQMNVGGMGGDRSNNVRVPNGLGAGFAFYAPLPTGVTGFASDGGGALNAKVNFSEVHININLPPTTFKDEPRSKFVGAFRLGFNYNETKDDGSFSVVADPSIFGKSNIRVREYGFRVGYDLFGEHTFENGVVGSLGAGLEGIYYHANLSGALSFNCPICTPDLQMLNQSASDTKNRLTAGASASVGVSYAVSDTAALFGLAAYNHEWNVPTVMNKVSPKDSGPNLGQGNRDIGTILFGLSYKF